LGVVLHGVMKRMDKIQFQKNELYTDSSTLGINSVEEIKKDIKRLEQEIDNKFNTYSNFSERIEQWTEEDSGVGFGFGGIEISPISSLDELEVLIDKLTDLNKAVHEANTSSSIRLHHRSKLDDYTQEFRRLKINVSQAWERAQLLRGRKYEPLPDRNINMDNLIRERGSIHNSGSMTSDLIMQAELVKDKVNDQTRAIMGSTGKMKSLEKQFPALTSIMNRVRTKKNRNIIILAVVISFCILFLLWWWWTGK